MRAWWRRRPVVVSTWFASGLASALLVLGCGGAEEKPSNAPLPNAWVREDQGRDRRPQSTVIGSPAPTAGQRAGRTPSSRGEEQARLSELRSAWQRVWSLPPGDGRAERACAERSRLAELARRWVRALVGSAADPDAEQRLRDASTDLRESLDALSSACSAGGTLEGAEPIEGAWHSVGAEIDELDAWAEALRPAQG